MNKQQGNVGSSNGTVIRESDEKQNMNNSSIITDNITVYNNTVGGKLMRKLSEAELIMLTEALKMEAEGLAYSQGDPYAHRRQ